MDNKKEQSRTTSKKAAMIKALATTSGNVSEALRQLNAKGIVLGRTAHYTWLENDKDYQDAISDALESTLDLVEQALINQIKNNSVQATMFYLKTKGRVRGYNEKQEIDLTSGEEPIQIIFNNKK